MGGMFGLVSKEDCVTELFYGTDYHSHLGTKRGGMGVCNSHGIQRSIHSLENNYFRTKFESELASFEGKKGIGVWFSPQRKLACTLFIIFVVAMIVTIVIGTFMRGPNWGFYWPWQPWPSCFRQ